MLQLFHRDGLLSYLEHAVSNLREAVELTDEGHPDKAARLSSFGNSLRVRFVHCRNPTDIDGAIWNHQKCD